VKLDRGTQTQQSDIFSIALRKNSAALQHYSSITLCFVLFAKLQQA
jgi:hypothetical protein